LDSIIAAGLLGIEHFTPPWDVIYLPLFNLLIGLYRLPFVNFAIAIVILTLIVRTIVAPLSTKQLRSSKELQRVAPLVREVKRKHKGNARKIQEETMALYKEHGVNPAAGCLPALLQLPILVALYQVLIRASGIIQGFRPDSGNQAAFDAIRAANLVEPVAGQTDWYRIAVSGPCNLDAFNQLPQFLPINCQLVEPLQLSDHVNTTIAWLGLDLARIDTVFGLVVGGFTISGIAIIAAILQFVQVKMMTPPRDAEDPATGVTATMLYMFPLMTIFWGSIFPAGLMLYWGLSSLYSIVQQYLVLGWGNLFPIFGWQPGFMAQPEVGITPTRRREAAREELAPAQSTNRPDPQAGRNKPRPNRGRSGGRRRGRRR
jgi:YidC/Oxa1 family membrane protein insertase